MTPEMLSLIGGGASGFLFSLVGKAMDMADRAVQRAVTKQEASDKSADAAAARSNGVVVRRGIVITVLVGLIIFPYINSLIDIPNVVEKPAREGLIGFIQGILGFGRAGWEAVNGYIILPEVRQALLAIVGFYFGSSQMRR